MRILAIETSCDETAAAVLEGRDQVLSSRIASQVDVHRLYGGVVPELASRCHIETIEGIVRLALDEAGAPLPSIEAVAVTRGPGLIGSLLVGVSFARALAWGLGKPVVGVNHLEGHIRAAFIENPDIAFPAVALVVSGGHTALYHMAEEGAYRLVAKTRDDAAGEAYDKVGKLLGLGYPGGPVIDRLAPAGDEMRVAFPSPRMSDGSLDFSFSGLKTAALRWAQAEGLASDWRRHDGAHGADPTADAQTGSAGADLSRLPVGGPAAAASGSGAAAAVAEGPGAPVRDLCASFQRAAVAQLVERTIAAARRENARSVILSGGVACNTRLRADLRAACARDGFAFFMPSPKYCTDNAAMIGAAGRLQLEAGLPPAPPLDADPILRLGDEPRRRSTRHR